MRTARRLARATGTRGISIAAALMLAVSLAAGVSDSASAGDQSTTAAQMAPASASRHAHAGRHARGHRLPEHFFGMFAPLLPSAYPSAPMGAVNLATNGVYWPQIEVARGKFDFSRLDGLVREARSRHDTPLVVLGLTPNFYAHAHAQSPQTQMPPVGAWKRYVKKVVERYGTRVEYEIWPEPDIIQNWSGTPRQLATLVATASTIIHRAARHAVVVGPAMVLRMRYQQRWMSAFYSQRVHGRRIGSYIDVVGVDPYPPMKGTPEDSLRYLGLARRIMAKHHVRGPLWNMEINYGVRGAGAPVRPLPMRTQASYVVRTYLLNAAAGVGRVYWLAWFNVRQLGVQMLAANNATVTPAGVAYRTVHRWLLGHKVKSCKRGKHHLFRCAVVSGRHTGWVYWTTKGHTKVRAPHRSRHLETITGHRKHISARKRLRITTAPVYVHH